MAPALPLRLELAFAEIEQAVRGAAIAHLVIQAGQHDIVALADAAVGVDQLLRYDEQRNALDARDQLAVLIRNLGQHQVHDVFRQLMLAGRDPHLVAAQPVAAVGLGFGARDDVRQRGAGLRFRQAHGAEEAPFQHRLDEGLDLLGRTALEQGIGVADGQKRVGRGADVGALEVGEAGLLHHARQLHAAQFEILAGGHQAGLAKRLQRHADLGNHLYAFAVEMRFLLVVFLVVRREQVGGDLLAGIHRRVEGFAAVVGEARPAGQALDIQPFVEQEFEIAAGKDHG